MTFSIGKIVTFFFERQKKVLLNFEFGTKSKENKDFDGIISLNKAKNNILVSIGDLISRLTRYQPRKHQFGQAYT